MKIEELQKIAFSLGLVIKIQVRETLGLCFFKIVVAEQKENIVKIWGEMKGWTFSNKRALQLDTLRIIKTSPPFVSELIWATSMAWAIEKKNSKKARLSFLKKFLTRNKIVYETGSWESIDLN